MEKSVMGLLFAVLLHGLYDLVLFQDDMPMLSLFIFPIIIGSVIIGRKAMKKHLNISPFNPVRK